MEHLFVRWVQFPQRLFEHVNFPASDKGQHRSMVGIGYVGSVLFDDRNCILYLMLGKTNRHFVLEVSKEHIPQFLFIEVLQKFAQ